MRTLRSHVWMLVILSVICSFPGAAPAHAQTSSPLVLRYRGSVLNNTYKIQSTIQMDLVLDSTTIITGSTTFSPATLFPRLCGAGLMTGQRIDNTLQYQFTSSDARQACTFTRGVTFTFTGTLATDLSTFHGSYSTSSKPTQQGIFTTTLTFDLGLPLVRRY